jgi:hypothetical protein
MTFAHVTGPDQTNAQRFHAYPPQALSALMRFLEYLDRFYKTGFITPTTSSASISRLIYIIHILKNIRAVTAEIRYGQNMECLFH